MHLNIAIRAEGLFPDPRSGVGLYSKLENIVIDDLAGRHFSAANQQHGDQLHFHSFMEEQLGFLEEQNMLLADVLRTDTEALRRRIIDANAMSPFVHVGPSLLKGVSYGIDDANAYFIGAISAYDYVAQSAYGKKAVSLISNDSFQYSINGLQVSRAGTEFNSRIRSMAAIVQLMVPSYVKSDLELPRATAVRVGMAGALISSMSANV